MPRREQESHLLAGWAFALCISQAAGCARGSVYLGDPPTQEDGGAGATSGGASGEPGAGSTSVNASTEGGATSVPGSGSNPSAVDASDGGASGEPGTGSNTSLMDASTDDGASSSTVDAVTLFGGQGDPDNFALNDTWQWDGASWTQAAASGPSVREGAARGVVGGNLVIFGGWDNDMSLKPYKDDTWSWNGADFTLLDPSTLPTPRAFAASAALAGKLVVFGGVDGTADPLVDTIFADTLQWDGSDWTQVATSGPSGRTGAVAATLGDKIVLFGGYDGNKSLADTWTWDGTTWTQVASSGPPARGSAVAATLNGKVYLFGGLADDLQYLKDTWAWDGSTWTEVATTGPAARYGAAAATYKGTIVLFGGQGDDDDNYLADTWTWDGTAWTQRIASGPSARLLALMAGP
jgi:N-acetylneuraminic acid mutarotase